MPLVSNKWNQKKNAIHSEHFQYNISFFTEVNKKHFFYRGTKCLILFCVCVRFFFLVYYFSLLCLYLSFSVVHWNQTHCHTVSIKQLKIIDKRSSSRMWSYFEMGKTLLYAILFCFTFVDCFFFVCVCVLVMLNHIRKWKTQMKKGIRRWWWWWLCRQRWRRRLQWSKSQINFLLHTHFRLRHRIPNDKNHL